MSNDGPVESEPVEPEAAVEQPADSSPFDLPPMDDVVRTQGPAIESRDDNE